MERGATGAVSALATAFPELVAAAVRDSSAERSAELGELRDGLEAFPRHAALKRIIGLRGVPLREDVRRPLRGLDEEERRALDAWATAWVARTRSARPTERAPPGLVSPPCWGHPGPPPTSEPNEESARVGHAACRK